MIPAAVPEVVGDSTAVLGLVITMVTCVTLLVGLLWKAFKVHDQIQDMAAELKPNHGSSLRDQIDAVRSLSESTAQSLVTLRDQNDHAHADLHRRIDGLFTMLGRAGDAARTAERHHANRED